MFTKVRDSAPTKYGAGAIVKNSLIADGCMIEGEVENSVLFRGVKIARGTVVKRSHPHAEHGDGRKCDAELHYHR